VYTDQQLRFFSQVRRPAQSLHNSRQC
jgi:hypothetical protein